MAPRWTAKIEGSRRGANGSDQVLVDSKSATKTGRVRIGYKLEEESGSATTSIDYGAKSCSNTMISEAVGAFQKTDDNKEGVDRVQVRDGSRSYFP